ncbi:MAG TPA: alpha-1,4-glucan--maltose-1-phosphate maltosyltransferase [Actinomycetales bacterium]|nr:alpha-1,4-glucan--maltose-1-phosphate maltosyltransferase [Actinomycetales bacterium]
MRHSETDGAGSPDVRADSAQVTFAAGSDDFEISASAWPSPIGRIPVVDVLPTLEQGRWPAKAAVGEAVPIQATIFREGHDAVAATAVLIDPEGREHSTTPMVDISPGNDLFQGHLIPDRIGNWSFRVEGWSDPYQTWRQAAVTKIAAQQDEELMLKEGALLLGRAAQRAELPSEAARILRDAVSAMEDTDRPVPARLAAGTSTAVERVLADAPFREFISPSPNYPLTVQRKLSLFSAWYEIFPRSEGAYFDSATGKWVSGTLRTAAQRLPAIAEMGFDVVYLTPVHPIGTTFRKGRNNTLTALPTDPGSPYAIGAETGGHDAIHPELGTFADFDHFVAAARELELEVALDLALQASPDHPWVKNHPEWFTTRADGTIAYAENPPKKYQDIYPLNFDNDPEGIYQEMLRIVRLWIDHGVTLFRVDNPHTKPLWFWERLLAEVAQTNPEIIFLSEAFTRPAMMKTLAKIGFHQSYSYFTWRNTKHEIEEYLTEISGASAAYMRPNFWPTTHDILTPYMQHGGPAAFAIRAVLAAMGSSNWGIYSGYELVENVARPGAEEQIDNEKYEFKPRDWDRVAEFGIADLLAKLNEIRRAHPALQQLRNLTIHRTSDDQIVCFSKHLPRSHSPTGTADTVIVVLNIDPHSTREATIELDLAALGLDPQQIQETGFIAHDLLTQQSFAWRDNNYVRLDPHDNCAHIIEVKSP